MFKTRFISMLVLLMTAVTGAYATEFTSLKVGDVLHLGDVINTSTDYTFCGGALYASSHPATLVRADISEEDITESETGAYYLLKDKNGYFYGYIFGEEVSYEGGYWPVTATSDGISVTAITPGDFTELTFAVHEAPANACGDGVTWALDNGVLTISYAGSGTGAMADFTESWESNPIPWKDNLYDITSIVIEEGVTSIGKMAFKDCDMLTSVSIPATVTSIGENAFANSGSPSGMTVTIAAGSALETIGTYAFMRSNLASINLPNGVTTIGDFAFAVCEKLASFTWPSSLTSIGMRAFQGTALTTVEIPATLTSIGDYAFMACSSLATITVADGNSAYEAPNGCNAIIDKNSHTLIQGCSGTVFEILPADLTTIGYASCSYFGFTSVTIPDGVTTIGEHAFEGCSDLTTVEIPASVTSIGEYNQEIKGETNVEIIPVIA